jgi:hypothetical protein
MTVLDAGCGPDASPSPRPERRPGRPRRRDGHPARNARPGQREDPGRGTCERGLFRRRSRRGENFPPATISTALFWSPSWGDPDRAAALAELFRTSNPVACWRSWSDLRSALPVPQCRHRLATGAGFRERASSAAGLRISSISRSRRPLTPAFRRSGRTGRPAAPRADASSLGLAHRGALRRCPPYQNAGVDPGVCGMRLSEGGPAPPKGVGSCMAVSASRSLHFAGELPPCRYVTDPLAGVA